MTAPSRRWCTREAIYGVQFHPEVTHSDSGSASSRISSGASAACGSTWRPSSAETIERSRPISARASGRRRTCCSSSAAASIPRSRTSCAPRRSGDRVHGVYVDTGFMRKNESADVMSAFEKAGFKNVRLRDASAEFLGAVGRETNPEIKRQRIGVAFLAVENDVLEHLPRGEWLLGQGTIYPDTIESGGTRESALIKTHHNRVPGCCGGSRPARSSSRSCSSTRTRCARSGARSGCRRASSTSSRFRVPGLAVRFLCTDEPAAWSENAKLSEVASGFNL